MLMLEPLKWALLATANCIVALLKMYLHREALVVRAFPQEEGALHSGLLARSVS